MNKDEFHERRLQLDRRLGGRRITDRLKEAEEFSRKVRKAIQRRVVITGLGIVAPIGIGKEEFSNGLKEGRNAVDNISFFNAKNHPSKVGAEIRNFRAEDFVRKKDIHKMGRGAHLGIAGAFMAVEDSQIKFSRNDRLTCPVIIGSSVGGMDFAEEEFEIYFKKGLSRVSPYAGIAIFCASPSGEISRYLSLRGQSITISNGCTSGSDAISYAASGIKNGSYDVAICGGADACVTYSVLGAFCRMGVTSTHYNNSPKKASRPFDKDRDGFVIGEGAWILIVEELERAQARGANIYAEICGYGSTCDAFHSTNPHPSGKYTAEAMRIAIINAGIKPEEIDFISAYGNATIVNDPYETMVIKKVFGQQAYKIPISSLKSMMGHPIGASGSAEVVSSAIAIQEGFIPPTINLDNPDPACDLDYVPNKARKVNIRTALCNTLSFGGKNSVIIIKRISSDT